MCTITRTRSEAATVKLVDAVRTALDDTSLERSFVRLMQECAEDVESFLSDRDNANAIYAAAVKLRTELEAFAALANDVDGAS